MRMFTTCGVEGYRRFSATGVWQKSGFSAWMKLCASNKVHWWQTVLCSEIPNFLNLQNVTRIAHRP